ncbi:MAG: glycoside hydrolase domain-containing protein [Candidatus Brocadiia bacterium]
MCPKALAVVLLAAAAAGAAPAVRTASRSTTVWSPRLARPADATDQLLYLWGEKGEEGLNRVLLQFDLPPDLAPRQLARARLQVFVPEVKDLRMICEIACRPVRKSWDAGGLALEEQADYGRGRPPGVLDSYAFWEYDGRWFPHKYRFLAPREGGQWIEFNVTPAVEEWLSRPAANHGLALHLVHLADKRFPNRARIAIPSHTHPEPERRPRLVLERVADVPPYLAGATHTLRKYCDRSTRYRFPGPYAEHYEMAMARNETEGFQVLVYPLAAPLEDVTFAWSDLAEPQSGATIPRADIACFCQEVFPRLHENGKIGDWYFHGHNFAMPDPLTPARPRDLPLHMATPFWFNVRTRPDTRPGTYAGTLTVRPANAPARTLRLTVTVWDYQIPATWNFETMGQTCWGYIRRAHGGISPELKRAYIDFLLDHRFSPTEQYIDKLSPDLEDIPYCIQRRMSTIYLSGNFRGTDTSRLEERYRAVEELGLLHKALVYIGDETKDWAEMRRRAKAIRRACPQAMVMIGGSFPRPELQGVIDIYDPQIDVKTNRVYSLPADQMRPLIRKAQARGEKFFWYVAAGPMLPCPNVQMEEPLIAARVLFWITWKFGVTGFEYYCYNIWSHNLPEDGKRWPEKPFYPRGWGNTNGDGMLFYPGPDGPLSSVRFETIRDGIEDWESHYVLRDYAEALQARVERDPDLGPRARPVLARAEELLDVPQAVTAMGFTSWTWEPEVLLEARRELGETIHALAQLVPEDEMLAVRKARKHDQLERQRRMLRRRAATAR